MLLQEKPRFTINIHNLFTTRRYVNIGNLKLELLDEKLIYRNGSYKRVRRWFKGAHPGIGVIIEGFTGMETVVEQDVIVPMGTFRVIDPQEF